MNKLIRFLSRPSGQILFVLVVLLACEPTACEPTSNSSSGSSDPVQELSAVQRTYQSDMTRLEGLKAEVEKYTKLESTVGELPDDPLERGLQGKSTEALSQAARELKRLAQSGLQQREVIQQVSGARSGYQEYLNYAENVIRKYQ